MNTLKKLSAQIFRAIQAERKGEMRETAVCAARNFGLAGSGYRLAAEKECGLAPDLSQLPHFAELFLTMAAGN